MFDLKDLFLNMSGQAIILLSIIALVVIAGGVLTQGFARTLGMVAGIFVFIMLILILQNAQEVGQWLKDKIWKIGMINPDQFKGVVMNGIQLFTRI